MSQQFNLRCATPLEVKDKTGAKVPVNCGKCPYCKKRRVNSWVFRLLEEDKISLSSYFITLTYDGNNVPITPNKFMTLKKRDYQLFMKRLRKLQKTKIKYYAVGEYGTDNWRPHYHAIIFNVEDIEHINTAWQKDGKSMGRIDIGQVSSSSIAYTAKYIDKERRIPLHARDDRTPEFSLMSKGLGKDYLTPQIKKYHRNDLTRMYVTLPGNHRTAMPKYYRDRIFSDSDKARQRRIIDRIERAEIKEYKAQFDKLYKNSDITFEKYMDDLKYAKYHKFYSTKNIRKL